MKPENRPILCVPGERICEAGGTYISGEGTYTFNKYIYASLAGRVNIVQQGNNNVVQVSAGQQGTVMPGIGSVVTCRVLNVNPNLAAVSIICVGPHRLHTPVSGTVRKQNVRSHQIDTVEMYDCFRPNDIILAVVVSLGDMRHYELSTADTELGVVTGRCEDGHPLVPSSWSTMRCLCRIERRKVAKVMPPKTT